MRRDRVTGRQLSRRITGIVAASTLIASGLGSPVATSASPSDGTYEVTSISTAGVPTSGQHQRPQLSSDGRYVAFDSDANLDPGDSGQLDVYVRDRVAGITERATVADDESSPNGGMFFGTSRLSDDGRHVLFTSVADNLLPVPDTNGSADVFLRDLDAGTTELVSVGPSGTQGNNDSTGADLSADGRYVVFGSNATNWGASPFQGTIWLRDRLAGTTTLLLTGNATLGFIGPGAISSDGNVILFAASTNGERHLYTYDRSDATVQQVDIKADGTSAHPFYIGSFAISDDGTVVAFDADDSLVPPDATGSNYSDVYVRDLVSQTTELVSVSSSGVQAVNTAAQQVSISGNGRFVGFTVEASFVPPPPGGWDSGTDTYVHDRVGGTTWHVAVDGHGINSAGQVGLDYSGLIASFIGGGDANSGLSPADGHYYIFTAVRTPDTQDPIVSGYTFDSPSDSGWFTTPPTIQWSAGDPFPSWGQPSAPPPSIVADLEGVHTYQSDPACDRAGNCATGSFEVKLDTTVPTVSITSPADGATYNLSQAANAAFGCSDASGGSGLVSCVGTTADGAALDTSTLGSHTLEVTATDDAGNSVTASHSYTVQGGSASQTLSGPGTVTTDPGGLGASPVVPIQTSVTIPLAGTVTISTGPITTSPPTGYSFFGRQVEISAPTATSSNPLVVTFTIDPSTGADPASLVIARDAIPLASCTGTPGTATPDPCVSSTSVSGDGDIVVSVYTSHASHWNLAVAANKAPSFTKGANQTVAEDSGPRVVSGWATNIAAGPPSEAGQLVDFIVTSNKAALFAAGPALSPGGALTFTPAPNANGLATVTVRAHDSGGTVNGGIDTSAAQSFTITVTPLPDAPAAASVSATTNEDTAALVTLVASDVDGDSATAFTIVMGPGHGTLSSLSSPSCTTGATTTCRRTITYRPALDYSGPDQFSYRVSDARLNSPTAVVGITVASINDAPVIAQLPNRKEKKNTAVTVSFTVGDVDNPASTLTATATSSNAALVPNGNITVGGSGSTRSLLIVPTSNGTGVTTITISVTDGQLSTTRSFSLTYK